MKLIAISIIALALFWHGIATAQEVNPDEPPWQSVEGQHYRAIDPDVISSLPTPSDNGQQTISFYFWPGSESCYQLDQALQLWHEQHPQILIERIPLVKRPQWRILAKAWLVAKNMDDPLAFLDSLYEKIHSNAEPIDNYLDLEQFVISRGLDTLEFKTQYHALSTNQQLQSYQLHADKLSIAGVPAIIINNRWYTDASTGISSMQMIAIIEQLIVNKEVDEG